MGFRSSRRSTNQEAETAGKTTRRQRSSPRQQSTSQRERSTGALWTRNIEQAEQHYGMAIPDDGTLQRLQIAEDTYGDLVHDWVDEGMPADILGKTRSMEEFRERQAQRSPEVPTDIERRNRRSVLRSEQAVAETDPAGEAGVPKSVREVISSSGRSLDASIQRAMEDRMGDSLGDVRIHTGPKAAAACEAINARAFTVGNHVAFNQGEYDPASTEGQHVLAHELAHVRQQTGGAVSMLPQEDMELKVDPDPRLEEEAKQTAQRVIDGTETGIQKLSGTNTHIQRHPKDNQHHCRSQETKLDLVEKNGGDIQETRWAIKKPDSVPGLDSDVIWLEQNGWEHILDRHRRDFINKYECVETSSEIEQYIKKAVKNPDETRLAKDNKAMIVHEIRVDTSPFRVIVGSNGFIQSAYPTG